MSDMNPFRSGFVVKIVLAAGVLGFVAWRVDYNAVAFAYVQASPVWIAFALLLLPLNIALQYAKWLTLVDHYRPGVSSKAVLASLGVGFSAGLITPSRLGELAGRALSIPDTDRAALLGLSAVDKAATLFVTLAVGVPTIAYAGFVHGETPGAFFALPVVLAGVLAISLVLVFLLVPGAYRWLLDKFPIPKKFRDRYERLFAAMNDVPRSVLVRLFQLSALFYVTFTLQFVLVARAFEQVDPITTVVVVICIMFAKSLVPQVTFGELGIREGAAVFFFTMFGYQASTGFNSALVIFAINVLLPAVAGLMFTRRLNLVRTTAP